MENHILPTFLVQCSAPVAEEFPKVLPLADLRSIQNFPFKNKKTPKTRIAPQTVKKILEPRKSLQCHIPHSGGNLAIA